MRPAELLLPTLTTAERLRAESVCIGGHWHPATPHARLDDFAAQLRCEQWHQNWKPLKSNEQPV